MILQDATYFLEAKQKLAMYFMSSVMFCGISYILKIIVHLNK